MVSLEQNDRTLDRQRRKGETNLDIGFVIMKVRTKIYNSLLLLT